MIIANNVMAHIPDLNGFVAGMAHMLADDGIITVENPWVHDLIEHGEFDTMYHEHIFYHSCIGVEALMNRHGLHLNHVEHFPDLHGGTLRYHISHHEGRSPEAKEFFATEYEAGSGHLRLLRGFRPSGRVDPRRARRLLTRLRDEGATVAAYGAAAKGSTLLNYAGIDRDLVSFVVDRNTHKQGLHMPGTHQPIFDPAVLLERSPDYLLLLAWNFADEIMAQQAEYAAAGGRFIRPIPTPEILTAMTTTVQAACPACDHDQLEIFHRESRDPDQQLPAPRQRRRGRAVPARATSSWGSAPRAGSAPTSGSTRHWPSTRPATRRRRPSRPCSSSSPATWPAAGSRSTTWPASRCWRSAAARASS